MSSGGRTGLSGRCAVPQPRLPGEGMFSDGMDAGSGTNPASPHGPGGQTLAAHHLALLLSNGIAGER